MKFSNYEEARLTKSEFIKRIRKVLIYITVFALLAASPFIVFGTIDRVRVNRIRAEFYMILII